ncbi:MAG: Dyp-type peroxidase [Owenweeksia sp.]
MNSPHLESKPEDLSHERSLRDREIWEHTQRGLVYPSPNAIFASYWLTSEKSLSRKDLRQIKLGIRSEIHTNQKLKDCNTTAVIGVGVKFWKALCEKEGLSLPKGMSFRFPEEDGNSSTVISRSSQSFLNNHADIWFHIKSDKMEACRIVREWITAKLGSHIKETVYQEAATKSTEVSGKGGKVLGSRFSENLNNPTDPISIAKHCIVGAEDIDHFGGSYALAQRFQINWDQVHSMSEDQIEDLVGRKTNDTIIPSRDTRTHIKSARRQDEQGNTTPVLRLGLPFGISSYARCPHLAAHGSNIADEAGIYFAGYAKSFPILETIMDNQIGSTGGFMNDRLFNHIKSDLGGLFYIPSIKDLELDTDQYLESEWKGKEEMDWSRFPGMDWSRLDRHFDRASDNGLMHYNHKEFLFKMSTMTPEDREKYNPPSRRILSLLENTFSRWQDNWYIDRKQEELGPIEVYLQKFRKHYPGEPAPTPEELMEQSIMIRKGWSVRLTLHEMSSDEYGFRGQRMMDKNGKQFPLSSGLSHEEYRVINGADTFRIQPEEIIVGGMPNLSLGEGRYNMLYLTEKERMDGFLANLSEASGVGHCIPSFERALEVGIDGLIADMDQYDHSELSEEKKDFYTAARLSLKGISEHCVHYAALAQKMASEMEEGQAWEKQNLQEIAARMKHVAHKPARTFIEALQLIFAIHSSLHLTGEPTALGRLDQILEPYYRKDTEAKRLTAEEAQEALDAFCLKLDEKVQSNRIFVEDHQPFGNLAMGGSSGPYPQGASINQWIQQVTVGGCDVHTGKAAYNDLTRMFLRCTTRLPLNAPCLSLRMREDMPDDIFEEAAKSVLSGGAHPLFLNDELFIEGLRQSGDQVGGEYIVGEAAKKWRSEVSIESARNYACDGCYEPQFPGENWFSLGGFSTLEPLECALNRGKTYSSAGMSYFQGKVSSFTSKPAEEIKDFEELLELYFKHFEWLNRKRIDGQLRGYGANTAYCPSPLLSNFVYDCIEKGQDYYSGGARYNIYGPCYIALSSTINSLYAIREMVFNDKKAITSLPELLNCLSCDWGYDMSEPFVSTLAGDARITAQADRYKRLREVALSLPRFGRGHSDIDTFGNTIIEKIADLSVTTLTQPLPQTGEFLADLALKMGTEELPFGIQIQPGVGTFENHVEMGAWNGASADGRRKGTTVASDMSSAPSPIDLPVDHQEADFKKSLAGFAGNGSRKMTDGGPTDFNIREDYPLDDLKEVLKQFAQARSSNILTITVANPQTMQEAMTSPEQYDLLRVRTGGWTAYFTAMFPNIQEQHRRRPISVADTEN